MSDNEHIVFAITETGQSYKWKSEEDIKQLETRLTTRESTFGRFIGIDDSGQPVTHLIWLKTICFVGIGKPTLVAAGSPRLM